MNEKSKPWRVQSFSRNNFCIRTRWEQRNGILHSSHGGSPCQLTALYTEMLGPGVWECCGEILINSVLIQWPWAGTGHCRIDGRGHIGLGGPRKLHPSPFHFHSTWSPWKHPRLQHMTVFCNERIVKSVTGMLIFVLVWWIIPQIPDISRCKENSTCVNGIPLQSELWYFSSLLFQTSCHTCT